MSRYALFVLALSAFLPRFSAAQEREDQARTNYFENDNAEAMREWFTNYLNPDHDPAFWQKRLDGMRQFAAMRNPAALKANPMAAWVAVGASQSDQQTPTSGNVSGRVLSFDIAKDGTFYLSPALGGIWKSNDRGQNWVAVSDGQVNSMCVSSVACDPNNTNVIYAGTGEYYASLSVFNNGNAGIGGTGVYKSTDAGLTWQLLAPTGTVGNYIEKILVSPANSNVFLGSEKGLLRSTDGGKTWPAEKYTTTTGSTSPVTLASGVEPFVIDPSNPQVLYAHTGSLFLKTTDGGDSWSIISNAASGLLRASGGYTSVAISRANPKVLYIAAAMHSNRPPRGGVGEIACSTDGGATWRVTLDTAQAPYNFVTQGDYCVALAASPNDENSIQFGGLDIYTSSSNGENPHVIGSSGLNSSDPGYTHADIRRLVYIGDTLFALADGGLFYNVNFGASGSPWGKDMNNKLNTFQQVGGDVFLQGGQPKIFIAGAQDNGTTKWVDGRNSGQIIHNGDAGRCFIEQSQGRTIYTTYPNYGPRLTAFYRSDDGGATWNPGGDGFGNMVANSDYWNTDPAGGYQVYDVCEKKFSEAVVCGAKYGWITHNGFNTISQMTPVKSGTSTISPTYIHIAKANASTLYFGGGNKCSWSTDAGVTWTAATNITDASGASKTSFNANPTWITSDRVDETIVFLTTSTTSGKPLYASTDGGATWWQPPQKLDNGQPLPSFVYRTVAVDKDDNIFMGGDGGVLAFDHKDSTWVAVTNGIPPGTMVTALQVRHDNVTGAEWLIATTYGRGMYYLNVKNFFTQGAVHGGTDVPVTAAIESIYPNPVSAGTSTIRYSLESGSVTNIAVFDNLGRQEKLLANEWSAKGEHEKQLDLSGLTAGTHYILLTADGVAISKAVTVQ